MDCEMPGMDGLEVTAAIRARERDESRERTPIVALSAHALPEDRERALAAGLDDYLVKPISRVQLHCTLARWLAVGGVD
jgi:CheY-like chemotaxis protein